MMSPGTHPNRVPFVPDTLSEIGMVSPELMSPELRREIGMVSPELRQTCTGDVS